MKILLGVSGSIAAVKTPELIRLLIKQGHTVTPILTPSAEEFVTPTSLAVLSQSKVYTQNNQFDPETHHIHLAKSHDIFLIAPCTANTLAKLAHGFASDLVSECMLMFKGPVYIAPAMHTEMWESQSVQSNINTLRNRNTQILGPTNGDLSGMDKGLGRLLDPQLIITLCTLNKPALKLQSKKILLTAGGTKEPLDTVRTLTNSASGKLGEAITHLAKHYGASVKLITTTQLKHNTNSELEFVETAKEMSNVVKRDFEACTALIMTAAVSDFTTPPSSTKLSRKEGLTLTLEPTEDILKNLNKTTQKIVAFCVADTDLLTKAREKLVAKNADIMIANTPDNIGNDKRSFTILSRETKEAIEHKDLSIYDTAYEILKTLI